VVRELKKKTERTVRKVGKKDKLSFVIFEKK
jgi:hypothetical protein